MSETRFVCRYAEPAGINGISRCGWSSTVGAKEALDAGADGRTGIKQRYIKHASERLITFLAWRLMGRR